MKKLIATMLATLSITAFAETPQYTVQVLDPSGQVVASTKVSLVPEGIGHPFKLEGRTIEPDSTAGTGFPIMMQGNIVKVPLLPPGCWINQNLNQICRDN